MPSRVETSRHAIDIFTEAARAYGASAHEAWLGIYAALLWYEPTNLPGFASLPHIIDADKLRLRTSQRKTEPVALTVWQKRAVAVERYLADQMGCQPAEVHARVDRLMRRPEYAGFQRQNSLGIAFIGLIHHALMLYGNPNLAYETEQKANRVFPGITFPGRSTTPSADVLARKGNVPRAVISVKWSLRHDRINDLTNECPCYKQAASWGRYPLDFVVLTNEYDPARLQRLLSDPCIDALIHVHKPAVQKIAQLDGRLAKLLDLTDLFALTHRW